MINPLVSPGSNTQFKRLRYGGTCKSCGLPVERGGWGWHDPDAKIIVCEGCREAPQPPTDIGGLSTLRWSANGNSRNRRKGAAGEYLMDSCLRRELTNGEYILSDRQVPGHQGNIDHIVVARSGVWIIDTKHWDGKIEYRGAKGFSDANERLTIGGKDHTYLANDIYAQVIPVAELIADRTIPIHPALVFINGDWSSTLRFLLGRPYFHNRVCISPPKLLASRIKAINQLSDRAMGALGARLDRALLPM